MTQLKQITSDLIDQYVESYNDISSYDYDVAKTHLEKAEALKIRILKNIEEMK